MCTFQPIKLARAFNKSHVLFFLDKFALPASINATNSSNIHTMLNHLRTTLKVTVTLDVTLQQNLLAREPIISPVKELFNLQRNFAIHKEHKLNLS